MDRGTVSPLIKPLLVGFILIVFHPFISRTTPPEIMYDGKRIFSCLVLVISCLYVMFNSVARNHFSQSVFMIDRPTKWILAVFTLCVLWVALLSAEYTLMSLYELSYLMALILFSFLVTQHIHIKTLIPFIKLINLLLFTNVALFFLILIANGYTPRTNLIFTFMNPRFLNQVQIWLFIPLAAFAFVEAKRQPRIWVSRVSLVIAFIIIYATDARGAFIAASGGMILLALLDKPHRKTWLKLWLYSATIAYVAQFILLDPLPSLMLELGEQTEVMQPRFSDSGRIEMWLEALKMSTWFGQGSGFFVCHSTNFGHPHNSILSVFIQWGAAGLICYFALVLKVFIDVVNTPSRLHRLLGVSLLTGVAYSLVSGVFITPISQLLAAATLGFYWVSYLRHHSTGLEIVSNSRIKKMSFILVVVAFISAVSISHRVYERVTDYPASIDPSKAKVQFWVGENCG